MCCIVELSLASDASGSNHVEGCHVSDVEPPGYCASAGLEMPLICTGWSRFTAW